MATESNLATGYVALYRSILKHDIYTRAPEGYLRVWLYCLLRATWTPRKVSTESGPLDLPVGAFFGALRRMAEESTTTLSEFRRAIHWLVKNEMLAQTSTHRFTVYRVVNFEFYNKPTGKTAQTSAQTEHRLGTDSAQTEHRLGTVQEDKKGIREEVNRENLVDSAGPNATFSLTGETSDNGTRKAKPKTTYTTEFAAWWEFRWRGDAKRKAELAYGGAVRYVMAKARCTDKQAHARLVAWAKEEPAKAAVPGQESRKAMMEATWLNGRRWEDEIREIHIEPEAGGDAFSRAVREGKFKGATLP